jgi:M6 family metalloprotease-like protein
MKKRFVLLFIVFINVLTWSQDQEIFCSSKQSENTIESSKRGGKFLTASGELKVLVVFAKFKDDNSPHPYWPIDSYPSEMNDFIDLDMQKGSTHFLNLTNYYNQMSFGNFRVTGKAIGVETSYPISHYVSGTSQYPNRAQANKDILQLVDDSIDYREFDNWTYLNYYNHSNEPDGIVDMVIVIWRGLVFTDRWSGESSLGMGPEFLVENNEKKIKMGFGAYTGYGIYGSGVTVQYWGEKTRERNFKVTIHEIAHWLIGSEHPYNNVLHTFWGMLTLGGEGICANTFEREKLAWINPTPIEETILSAPIGDYVTTPSAYKYNIPNGFPGETYYFENHQQLSIYDNGISNPDDKGIFILHVANGFYANDCVRVLTSDGFWNWDVPFHTDCWGNDLPAFRKKYVNRNGFGNRDKIVSEDSCCGLLYSYVNEKGEVECNDWLHGYGFNNSFNTTFNDLFSQWSNPPAKTWNGMPTDLSMEIVSENGNVIDTKFILFNSTEVKPSKPAIGLDPKKINQQYKNGWIYLAWGADVWDNLLIEPDIDSSELQIKIDSGEWNTIYLGMQRYWSDSSYNFDSTGNMQAQLRVRVRNTHNQWSVWSNTANAKIQSQMISSIDSNAIQVYDLTTNEFLLFPNYPNPFNSSTKISWQSPIEGWQSVKVYDILGNEIAILLNEYKQAGRYSALFSNKNTPNYQLSSGIYIYQLTIQSEKDLSSYYRTSQKMIILK